MVWYFESDRPAATDPVVRAVGRGELLIFNTRSISRITLDGTEQQVIDMSAVDSWHHDAVLMPGGGVLALPRLA